MTDPTLEDHLLADEMIPADHPEHFEIVDDSQAAWAMRKLRRLTTQRDANSAIAADEIARIEQWSSEVNAPLDRDILYFESILSHYALRCRQTDGRKSIKLPTGAIATRQPGPRWDVDADVFIPWAQMNRPDLLRIRVEPALAEMKRTLEAIVPDCSSDAVDPETGEQIPGLVIIPQEPTASISIDAD